MPAYEIQKLNHRHEQIINWLIANPDRSLRDCAAFFGYTPQWVGAVVASDAFQYVYRRRCEELGTLAVHTMAGRLGGLAVKSLDAIEARIDEGLASERLLESSLNTALKGLGYTANGNETPAVQQHLHLHGTVEDLTRAREKAAALLSGVTAKKSGSTGGPDQETGPPIFSSSEVQ